MSSEKRVSRLVTDENKDNLRQQASASQPEAVPAVAYSAAEQGAAYSAAAQEAAYPAAEQAAADPWPARSSAA